MGLTPVQALDCPPHLCQIKVVISLSTCTDKQTHAQTEYQTHKQIGRRKREPKRRTDNFLSFFLASEIYKNRRHRLNRCSLDPPTISGEESVHHHHFFAPIFFPGRRNSNLKMRLFVSVLAALLCFSGRPHSVQGGIFTGPDFPVPGNHRFVPESERILNRRTRIKSPYVRKPNLITCPF